MMIDMPGQARPNDASSIVRLDLVGTALFVVSAGVAAWMFTSPLRIAGVVIALALFSAGVVAFLWSYWTAVQRSRADDIAVAQLYFLVGGSTPREVRRTMNLALAVQVLVALVTAIARSTTDGRAGSTLAFGILVPMFGLGLNGLWCSKFGTFPARAESSARSGKVVGGPLAPGVHPSHDEMEQTSPHG